MSEGPSPFEQAVLQVLLALAPGDVVTYGEVAEEAGYPGRARAVGHLLARGPRTVAPSHGGRGDAPDSHQPQPRGSKRPGPNPSEPVRPGPNPGPDLFGPNPSGPDLHQPDLHQPDGPEPARGPRADEVPWWRVVAANGRLVPGMEAEHARRLRAEGVPTGPERVAGMAAIRRARRSPQPPVVVLRARRKG